MMCMQLVICEKPSVGAAFAKAPGVTKHKNRYIEGDNIIVSWCIGHLVELVDADTYDDKYRKRNIADLPIIPQEWQSVVSTDRVITLLIDYGRCTGQKIVEFLPGFVYFISRHRWRYWPDFK